MSISWGCYEELKKDVLEKLLDGYAQKFYVEEWEGVGATAFLREVAEAVEKREERKFETVIKVVRPALFRNRREMQRAVAEQLNLLSPSVRAAFDAADEDDDFSGVEFSRRDQLLEVKKEIYRAVEGRSMLLVFCNNIANGKPIDPENLAIPIIEGSRNVVLMTSRSSENSKSISPPYRADAHYLAYKEAFEIARYIDESSGGSLQTTPQVVLLCYWYCLLLLPCRVKFNRLALLLDGNWPLEAFVRYFVCDGILQGDAAWEIGKALAPLIVPMVKYQLQQYWEEKLTFSTWMPRGEKKELLPPKTLLIDSPFRDWVKLSLPLSSEEESYRWISVRYPQTNNPKPWDFFFREYRGLVMSDVSSVFWHFEKTLEADLPDGFFDYFSNIRVLDLLGCVVSPIGYSSFLCLRNLRMLRLERCKVTSLDPNSHSSAREGRREPIFFANLWVLNLYHLDANTFLLAGKAFELMPNLRELDLTSCEGLEYLNFNLPATIETISLQRCPSLKEEQLVDPTAAPLPNLTTFRLSSSKLIAKLSLQGCRKLENVDLQGLMGLEVLDLSCTTIKVVDINKFPQLKQIFLLGCEQLRRVACSDEGPKLNVLYLDNYNGGDVCDVDQCLDSFRNQRPSELPKGTNDVDQRLFHAHVVVRDVRLFRSLHYAFPNPLRRAKYCFHIHVKGSSTAKRGINIGTTTRSNATITLALCYSDALNTMTDCHRRHHPSPLAMPLKNHIEVDGCHDSRIVEERAFRDILEFANSLFMHDNTSNFIMNITLEHLKCFRIERCPNLEFIFSWRDAIDSLESIWLSQLPRLKALCERGWINRQLKHIYLEFCARLEYLCSSLFALHDLETISIRYCGDLTAIFKSDDCGDLTAIFKSDDDNNKDKRGAAPKLLPKLRSIHLQELPKLQHIHKLNICAPSLEELKITGCFNLKKLPLFSQSDTHSMRAVKISCEKDWWDKLQWDGLESNHHASLFKPKHCPYYKKRMKARYL